VLLSATAVLADELDLDGLLLRLTAARGGTAAAAAAADSDSASANSTSDSASGDAAQHAQQAAGQNGHTGSQSSISRSASAAVAALAAAVGASVGFRSNVGCGGVDEDDVLAGAHSTYLPRWARQQQQQQQLEGAQQGSSSSMGSAQAAAAAGRADQGRLWVPPPLPTATLDLRHAVAAAAAAATDAATQVPAKATTADGSLVPAQQDKVHKAFAGPKGAAGAAAAAKGSSGSSSIKAWRGWQDDSSSSSSSSSDGDESDDSEEDWKACRQQARSSRAQQQQHGNSQQQANDAGCVEDAAEIAADGILTLAAAPAATSGTAAAAAVVATAHEEEEQQRHVVAATQSDTGASAADDADAAEVGYKAEPHTTAAAATQAEVEAVVPAPRAALARVSAAAADVKQKARGFQTAAAREKVEAVVPAPRAASAELSVSIAAVHSRLQALLAPAAAPAAGPGQERTSTQDDSDSDDNDGVAAGHCMQQPESIVVDLRAESASCAAEAVHGASDAEVAAVAAPAATPAVLAAEGEGASNAQQRQQPDLAEAAPVGQDHRAAADSTTDTSAATTSSSSSISQLVLSPYLQPEQQAEQHLSMLCISPADGHIGCFTTLAVADLIERVLALQQQLGLAAFGLQYRQQVLCNTQMPVPADGKSSSSSSSSIGSQLQLVIYWPTAPGVSKVWLPRQQQVQLLQAALQADDLPECKIHVISGSSSSGDDAAPGSFAANRLLPQQQQLIVSCIREGAFEIRSDQSSQLLPAVLRRAAAVGLTLLAATTFHVPTATAAAAGNAAISSKTAAAAVAPVHGVLPAHKPLPNSSTVALLLAGSGRDPVGRWAEQIGPSGDLAVITDAASLHAQFWQQQQQVLVSCSHDSTAAANEAQLLFPGVMEHWQDSSSSSSVAYSAGISTAAGAANETAAMTSNGDVTAAVWPLTDSKPLHNAFAALQHLAVCGFAVTDLCSAVMLRDGFAAAASNAGSSSSTADDGCKTQALGGSAAVHSSSGSSGSSSMPTLVASLSKSEALSTAPAVLDLWRSTSSSSTSNVDVDGEEFAACLLPGNAVQMQHLRCLQESCCGIPASFEAGELLNAAQQQQKQQQKQLGMLLEQQQQQQHWWHSRSGVTPQHGLQQLVAVAVPASDMEAALAVLQALLCEVPSDQSENFTTKIPSGLAGVSPAEQLPTMQLAAVRLLGRLPVQAQQQQWIQPAAAAAAAGGARQGRVPKGHVLLAVLYGVNAQSRAAAGLTAAVTARLLKATSSSSSSTPSSWTAAVQTAAAAASITASHRAAASALAHCFDQSQTLPTAGPMQDLLLLPPPTAALCYHCCCCQPHSCAAAATAGVSSGGV
jgi:hypothetical protein